MKPFDPSKVRVALNTFPSSPFRLVGPRRGRAVKAEIDISSGLLAWDGHCTVTSLLWSVRCPSLGSDVSLSHYGECGWLRIYKYGDKDETALALAIASARKMTGFNGQKISMPPGFYVRRGILWDQKSGDGVCILNHQLRRLFKKHEARIVCSNDEFEPIDDTPITLCRINDKTAREAALRAFEKSR